LEFEFGDKVFLKVSATKGISRFAMVGKLSSKYVGPYPIIQRVKGGEHTDWSYHWNY